MTVPVLTPVKRWHCPQCRRELTTTDPRPHAPLHPCPGLRGLTVPMVQAGTKAKLSIVEREDYVGRERVQTDPEQGRPVTAVTVEREHGQDVTIFAPAAAADGRM